MIDTKTFYMNNWREYFLFFISLLVDKIRFEFLFFCSRIFFSISIFSFISLIYYNMLKPKHQ